MNTQADQHIGAVISLPMVKKRFLASDQPDLSEVMEALDHLEAVRHHPVLLYMAQDQAPFPKLIEGADSIIFYDALRSLGPLEHLDLVVNTIGGNITAVRKLLHILHAMVSHLTILVPYKACSAGTLLCLGAHDLVLTPIAELSPIDPQLRGLQGGNASQHSSEDVALFRMMARDWFGVHSDDPDHALLLLRLLCEKIFPLSLTHFFRAERLVRQIAQEALRIQLPEAGVETHQRIIEQLLTGYMDHQYPLNASDLLQLGLHVTAPSVKEEEALWLLWQRGRAYLDVSGETSGADRIDGLLLGTRFAARHLVQSLAPEPQIVTQAEGSVMSFVLVPRWERLDLS